MRRFVLHMMLFVAVQAVIAVSMWRACPRDSGHYMAATLDKHARLRESPSPRLILVGGSTVAFGIDSRPFEGLGLTAVNMGLSQDLGLSFMVEEIRPALRRGDVVIVAPETHLFWRGSTNDAIWAVLERRPANALCLSADGAREAADQALHFLARKIRCAVHQMSTDREFPALHRRSSFDERGDYVAHRALSPGNNAPMAGAFPPAAALDVDRAIDTLAELGAYCTDVGARCFVAWCPTRRGGFEQNRDVYEMLESRLRDEVAMPMLETPREVIFDDSEFFDVGRHLTGDAADRRSARLAARLAARGE